jgi:hypothetical protein
MNYTRLKNLKLESEIVLSEYPESYNNDLFNEMKKVQYMNTTKYVDDWCALVPHKVSVIMK